MLRNLSSTAYAFPPLGTKPTVTGKWWTHRVRALALTALFCIASVACSPDGEGRSVPGQTAVFTASDDEVAAAVNSEVSTRLGPAAGSIFIDVATGIVTLAGAAPSLAIADRALRITKQVIGVRGVVNLVEVRGPSRSDSVVRMDVEAALTRDPATDGFEIAVSVDDGAVTLEGAASSWRERELAPQVTRGVTGVKEVKNSLVVDEDRDRKDVDIAADIRRTLQWDVRIDEDRIDVDVDSGIVVLTGEVRTLYERDLAIRQARVLGVTAIVGELKVASVDGNERIRTSQPTPRSEELVDAIEEALERDPRVASFDIHTAAQDGTVLLLGRVSHLNAKLAAEEDALNTIGVDHVNNSIEVTPGASVSDAMLEVEVERVLTLDPTLRELPIDVLASSGSVQISGHAPSPFHKEWAGDVVSRIPGVINVENDLTVDPIRETG